MKVFSKLHKMLHLHLHLHLHVGHAGKPDVVALRVTYSVEAVHSPSYIAVALQCRPAVGRKRVAVMTHTAIVVKVLAQVR